TEWGAANCLTARRSRALELFRAGGQTAHGTRRLPGAYSWKRLRGEAEARFAAGEPPRQGTRERRTRELHRPAPQQPPSEQTFRRWCRDGRWRHGLDPDPVPGGEPGPGSPGADEDDRGNGAPEDRVDPGLPRCRAS